MEHVKTRKTITLATADMIAHAAELEAIDRRARVVIAIVDDHGKLILLRRLDHTQVASVDVAIDKARTAAIFRRPSRDIEVQVSGGRFGALALAGAVALQGGIPLGVDGDIVGAIGVSGETPAEDEAVALAGARCLREGANGRASR
jgi:glc operon protein GlcG